MARTRSSAAVLALTAGNILGLSSATHAQPADTPLPTVYLHCFGTQPPEVPDPSLPLPDQWAWPRAFRELMPPRVRVYLDNSEQNAKPENAALHLLQEIDTALTNGTPASKLALLIQNFGQDSMKTDNPLRLNSPRSRWDRASS